jgi:hypothetical protein
MFGRVPRSVGMSGPSDGAELYVKGCIFCSDVNREVGFQELLFLVPIDFCNKVYSRCVTVEADYLGNGALLRMQSVVESHSDA